MTVAWWADALQWIIQSGFIPILIAFFALVISAYSVYISRRTALLSAKPILMLVFDCHSEESKATVEIQNVGLGPAIIFDFQFLYHNKVIDTEENYKNLTSELMGVDKYGYIYKYCVSDFPIKPQKGCAIVIGQNQTLKVLETEQLDEQRFKVLVERLQSFDFKYKYKCIYGKRQDPYK